MYTLHRCTPPCEGEYGSSPSVTASWHSAATQLIAPELGLLTYEPQVTSTCIIPWPSQGRISAWFCLNRTRANELQEHFLPVLYRSQIGLSAVSDFWPQPIEFRTVLDTAPDIFFPVFLRGKILKMLSLVSPRSSRSAGHSFPTVSRPGQMAPAAPGFAASLKVFPLHLLPSPGCGTASGTQHCCLSSLRAPCFLRSSPRARL